MYTDPIADLLVRIKNAFRARKTLVRAPYSEMKYTILKILEKNKYVEKVEVEKLEGNKKNLVITLPEKSLGHVEKEFKRVSKSGRRLYVKADEIKPINNGYGLAIISTSKGLMTNYEAHHAGLGGEMICEVY